MLSELQAKGEAAEDRIAIVNDGFAWFVRRIRVIEHDLDLDEKVYRCDKPLGGPFADLKQAVLAVLNESSPATPGEE